MVGNYNINHPAHPAQIQDLNSRKPNPISAVADKFSGNDLVRTLSVDSLFRPGATNASDGTELRSSFRARVYFV